MALAPNISNSFIRQWDTQVRIEYQRLEALLRGTVHTVTGVVGRSHTFFQGNDTMTMRTKARNGRATPEFTSRIERECFLQDRYLQTPVDYLDEEKVNHDELSLNARQHAAAAGRHLDEQIIQAVATTVQEPLGAPAVTLTRQNVQLLARRLRLNDVPFDGDIYGLVTPAMWDHLLSIKQFSSSDYQNDKPFIAGYEARRWAGVNWMCHTGLPGIDTATATGLVYHKNAVGLAIGTDIKSMIQENSEKVGHDITTMMSTGALLINGRGAVKFTHDDTAAIPAEVN